MAKTDPLERKLAELKQLQRGPEGVAALKKLLADKDAHVVKAAAELAGRWGEGSVVSTMMSAFERFVTAKDPSCGAKTAIARVLCEWESVEGAKVFERGVAIFQREPVWGGSVDVAGELRGWSALGLAAIGHREQIRLILPLLADEVAHARMTAARALAQGESEAGEALVRLKVLLGDPDEGVIAECLSSLVSGWPGRSVGFVGSLVEKDALRPAALLALGECRDPKAWAFLMGLYENDLSPIRRREVIGAVAVSRRAEALDWLVGLIEDGSAGEAAAVVEALAVRRGEAAVWERVERVARERENALINDALERVERGE